MKGKCVLSVLTLVVTVAVAAPLGAQASGNRF